MLGLRVSAFSASAPPLRGNPAVIFLSAPSSELVRQEAERQAAAPEPAAHASVSRIIDGSNRFAVRFFAPNGSEIPLCGHASLAAAHALWSSGSVPDDASDVFLEPQLGLCEPVRLARLRDGVYEVRLRAPALLPAAPADAPLPAALCASLGLDAAADVRVEARTSAGDVIILASHAAFAAMRPDGAALCRLFGGARIVSVTSAGGRGTLARSQALVAATGLGAGAADSWREAGDVVSRCFARGSEDPVCAAAHTGLVVFWAAREHAAAAAAERGDLAALQSSWLGGLLVAALERGEAGEAAWVRLRGECS